MMKAAPKQTSNINRSAASAAESSRETPSTQPSLVSGRMAAQQASIAGINDSPRMLAQRQRIDGYLGSGQPPSAEPAPPASSIAQQQPIQRLEKPDDEKEETLQPKFASEPPAQLERQATPNPNNTGLPDNLKSGIEALSGMSMDNVKVHYNSSQPAQLNALAYAQGTDIHVAPGQEKHLPHEAWHVVQQAQGRVKPTMQMKGIAINDDTGLEAEADVMGGRAFSVGVVQGKSMKPDPIDSVAQCYFVINEQKTNDQGMFPIGITTDEAKKIFIWENMLMKALNDAGVPNTLVTEFKDKLLEVAMNDKRADFKLHVEQLKELEKERKDALVPLNDRPSPAALDKLLSTVPELDEKEKHSLARYRRQGKDTLDTFDPDAYTKGPAKRRRDELPITTPKGLEVQVWTTQQIQTSIRKWSCEIPLARHLAMCVWPLLKNSDEGKMWELKFREMDRLIDIRDGEKQNWIITILRTADKAQMCSVNRKDITKDARQALRQALLQGQKHPADQQDVLFYDDILKKLVPKELQVQAESKTFDVNQNYTVVGDLSMILTHWRPILFFDWILAEDVLNNVASSGSG